MFIGHFAAGLGAKRLARGQLSLGTLFFAALLPDLLMPVFFLVGIERIKIQPQISGVTKMDLIYYPFSHSLISCVVQALFVIVTYYLLKRRVFPAIILGGLVIFHFVLDVISHRPDVQLVWWNEYRIGLGLWNSVWLTLLVEGSLFALGALFYFKATRAKNKRGTIGLVSLLMVLAVIYLMSVLGPPPPSEREFAYASLLTWLFVGWASWIDKNRLSLNEPWLGRHVRHRP